MPKYTGFGGLKLYPPLLKYMGMEGLVAVKKNAALSVSFSPFGWVDEGGTVFIKGAPLAKMKTESQLAAGDASEKAIASGLGRAKGISRAHTEEGIAIVNIPMVH